VGDQRRSEVRSYRSVFALERRIYRIDRLRLNPSGVPVRGVGYAVVLVVLAQLAKALPVIGPLAGVLPWPIRELIAPVVVAAGLTALRLDGRPAHHALIAALRFAAGPRHLSGFTPCAAIGTVWRPGSLVSLPDGSEPRLRSLRYRGPGRMLVRVTHGAAHGHGFRGSELRVAAGDQRPRGIRVPPGGRVRVRGARACERR
jgi:hypothetical protein